MLRLAFGFLVCSLIFAQSPRELFQARCAVCHGPTGEGSRGPALKVPVFQRANDLDSLVSLLRNGIPGTEMSAISSSVVADEPLRSLAAYVLAMRANNTAGAGDRLGRGAALFRSKGKCLDCHRVNG